MAGRALSFCGAATLVVALCLVAATTAVASEAEAIADAEARLASVALPPGAIQVSEKPEGVTAHLNGPPEEPLSPNLVDRGGWWVAPETAAEALSWFRANPPDGTVQRISGGATGPGGSEFSFLDFEWPATTALSWRALTVAAATRTEGGTALRIDAQDVWIERHPASEAIPKGARFLEVVWQRRNGRDSTASTTNLRFIRSVSAEIDSLPIGQRGVVYGCPDSSSTTTVTVRFRPRRGGPALATAVQQLPTGVCSPMSMTIGGERRPALEDAGPVIARLRKLR